MLSSEVASSYRRFHRALVISRPSLILRNPVLYSRNIWFWHMDAYPLGAEFMGPHVDSSRGETEPPPV